jgi:phage-related protein (TIGR01555 family)
MPKQSIKAAVRDAKVADTKARRGMLLPDGTQSKGATLDSFVNFAQKLGVGADNALSTASYGYNPITRNRILLEWIHRGSWLGGVAVDTVADDMTRAGVEMTTDIPPEQTETIEHAATKMCVWDAVNEGIRWARLYGGSVTVALIDGQDPRQPLNLDAIGPGQFKGLLPLDRWMVEPSLEDLVTEYGPHLGLPRYYKVQSNAPALRGAAIHHSRVMFRLVGIQLPYQQRLTENLWGLSVLERLYDRMIAFDSASTGAAQLVYKSYLRTLKVEGLREIVAAGGAPMTGLMAYVDVMRRYQGQEGITLLDKEDEFDTQQHSAFSGLSDALNQFGQQLSGALQIPLVRLFGQSPAGLNSTGESDLRMYYDHIKQQQVKTMHGGATTVYQLIAKSKGIQLPPNFAIDFKSLWQLSDTEKADIAGKIGDTVNKANEGGLIGRQTSLKELRQSSRVTGVFTNITDELINAADDEVQPPGGMGEGGIGPDGLPLPMLPGIGNQLGEPNAGQEGKAGAVPNGPNRRVKLQLPFEGGSPAD